MEGKKVPQCMIATVFKKAFRVLLVDDEEPVRSVVQELFGTFPLFRLVTVDSARDAERRLMQEHFHLCFCDLGISDREGDQHFLVKSFGRRLPVIIMSGRASMEESARCMSLGATWVFDKPVVLNRDLFIAVLNRFLPFSLFLYGTQPNPHTRYREAIDALIMNKPASVEEWARAMNVNERYVRKICETCPLPLRHMINTFHLVDCALVCGTTEPMGERCGAALDWPRRCERAMEFYCMHRRPIDRFLRVENGICFTGKKT